MDEYQLAQMQRQGKIINSALEIVRLLADSDMADIDHEDETDDVSVIKDLIVRARTNTELQKVEMIV